MHQKVRKGEELPEKELLVFLHSQGLIDSTNIVINISQFANGFSNLTYLLDVGGKEIVLRRPPKGAIKHGHDMGREFKVLSGLQSYNKAPDALAYYEDHDIMGTPFYIMEKVNGIILTNKEAGLRKLPPADYGKISDKWLDALVELHEIDYQKMGLGDLGKPEGYIERQVRNWGKQYIKASTEEVQEAEQVMKWMLTNQPKNYNYSLIHNDFKYDNVVFKDESWDEISAILDWEMCTLGDPLMDLGTSLAYWTTAADGDLVKQGIPSPTIFLGNPTRTEIVQTYSEKSGRNIDNLIFYYVYGLFKIATIAQQIYYRYSRGLTKDPKFAQLNTASKFLCVIALQAINKKRIENLF